MTLPLSDNVNKITCSLVDSIMETIIVMKVLKRAALAANKLNFGKSVAISKLVQN